MQFWFKHVKHITQKCQVGCDICDLDAVQWSVDGCVTYAYVNQPQNSIYTGSVGQASNAGCCPSQRNNYCYCILQHNRDIKKSYVLLAKLLIFATWHITKCHCLKQDLTENGIYTDFIVMLCGLINYSCRMLWHVSFPMQSQWILWLNT